jgi:hypothetical protein
MEIKKPLYQLQQTKPLLLYPFSVHCTNCHMSKLNFFASDKAPLDNLISKKFQRVLTEKGKAIPLQAWTGPEDSRRLRLPDFKTIGCQP